MASKNAQVLATKPHQSAYATFGLTIREHFAAMAMQGLLVTSTNEYASKFDLAKDAVLYADALCDALNEVPVAQDETDTRTIHEPTGIVTGNFTPGAVRP